VSSHVILAYIQLMYAVEREAREAKLNPEQAPGVTPGEIRARFWRTSRITCRRKAEAVAKSPIAAAIRLHVIELGSAAALHRRRAICRSTIIGRTQPPTPLWWAGALAFLRERPRGKNRSRTEHSDRQPASACTSSPSPTFAICHAHKPPPAHRLDDLLRPVAAAQPATQP